MPIIARRRVVLTLTAGFTAYASSGAAAVDNFPSQPIKIIVGYAPGGNSDIQARLFGNELSRVLGVPVLVENRPGASGVPAAQYVSRAKPDGYTLLWGSSASHSVAVVTMAPLPYDPVQSFTPITLISVDPNVIVGARSIPANTVLELIDYLKAHPKSAMGTAGPATSGRFATELMKPQLGIDMVPVPYRSAGPLLNDLVGGKIPFGIMGASIALPFLADGSIKAFAVTGLHRSLILPQVPTFDETVAKGFDAVAWSALYAPLHTPDSVTARILAAMREAAQAPNVQNWVRESGLEVPLGSQQELVSFMQTDIKKWVQVARENHLTFTAD